MRKSQTLLLEEAAYKVHRETTLTAYDATLNGQPRDPEIEKIHKWAAALHSSGYMTFDDIPIDPKNDEVRKSKNPLVKAIRALQHNLPDVSTAAAAIAQRGMGVAPFGRTNLEEASRLLVDAPYSRFWLAMTSWQCSQFMEAAKDPGWVSTFQIGCDAMADAFGEEGLNEPAKRALLDRILDVVNDGGETRGAILAKVVAESPKFDQWTKDVVAGAWGIEIAWHSRGTKMAYETTAEQWRGFETHLATARKHLTAAHTARPDLPEAASLMIVVAMAGHAAEGEDEEFWFKRSQAAQYDYMPSYRRYVYSLRPKWGGDHRLMLRLGLRLANEGRYETRVPLVLNDVINDIASETKDHKAIMRIVGVWDTFDEMMTGICSEPVRAEHREFYLKVHAEGALMAGRWTKAAELLKEAKVDLASHPENSRTFNFCRESEYRSYLRMLVGEQGIEAAGALDLAHNGKHAEAAPILARLADQLDDAQHGPTVRALRENAARCRAEAALAEGKAATVETASYKDLVGIKDRKKETTTTMQPGVRALRGQMPRSFPTSSLQFTGAENLVHLDWSVGTRFEITATIDASEVPSPSTDPKDLAPKPKPRKYTPPNRPKPLPTGIQGPPAPADPEPPKEAAPPAPEEPKTPAPPKKYEGPCEVSGGVLFGISGVDRRLRYCYAAIDFGSSSLVVGNNRGFKHAEPIPGLQRTATIRVQAWDEAFVVYVNDKKIWTGTISIEDADWGELVGAGTLPRDVAAKGTLLIHGFSARRITAMPKELIEELPPVEVPAPASGKPKF